MDISAYLDEICRLCLTNKSMEKFKMFFKIEDTTRNKFEDVTNTKV
jgi:hypothetical protein